MGCKTLTELIYHPPSSTRELNGENQRQLLKYLLLTRFLSIPTITLHPRLLSPKSCRGGMGLQSWRLQQGISKASLELGSCCGRRSEISFRWSKTVLYWLLLGSCYAEYPTTNVLLKVI